jgi:hypothetical protein
MNEAPGIILRLCAETEPLTYKGGIYLAYQ